MRRDITFVLRMDIRIRQGYTEKLMEQRPVEIGITCFPLIGGSAFSLHRWGWSSRRVITRFISSVMPTPVRLDLTAPRFIPRGLPWQAQRVSVSRYYTLPWPVKMADVGRAERLDLFHVHYASAPTRRRRF